MSQEVSEEEWERVLWKRKPYPDNYVPRSFLSSLSRNPNFRPYTYGPLVLASCAISQHLAAIFIFLATFVRLKEHYLDPRVLVWISTLGFIVGYAVWELLLYGVDRKTRNESRSKTIKSSILVFLALMSLSPVLKTLTAATSSDSIWALSAFLFILNVLLADYTALALENYRREKLTSVLSINAAISSSVVLASRLPNDLSVFALVLFAVQSFAMFPILRRRLQSTDPLLQATLTAGACAFSIYATWALSRTVTYLFTFSYVFVLFLAPAILVWAQRFKNEIRGTWDPAVPRINETSLFS
ncbi:phosphatidylinositol N-acetylglucosaminyltransferase [Obba rivulosa]|uniref:Phosphatidylinositol N-acetylglucosaminyltransferase n=1 Tax=Obba rivulosa TaxID=1052685 RepID=A0A8E2DUN1_9APHY|nr:phosphatidylinositol N-acetylglucosaminyltransferase [Obba rivulosa]